MFFGFTELTLLIGGNIFTVAIRAILKGNTALPSYVFSATSGSPLRPDGLSIVNATSTTSKHSKFNVTHLFSVGPLLLLGNVCFVSSI